MKIWTVFGEYIDYITKLGIYCKLYDKQFSIQRPGGQDKTKIYIATSNYADFVKRGENFEEFMMTQNINKMQEREVSFYTNNKFLLFDGENESPAPQLQDIKKAILEKFSKMNLKDIENSGISQYEYRKIIGMKYQDIQLTQEDIEALNLYKHGLFYEINGFLRGDLSEVNESEEQFVKDMPQIIECIKRISKLQDKFISDTDMTLVRTDRRINNEITPELEYDNFVSTTANDKLFFSKLDGIKRGGYIYIKVPKGTPMIPMDIVTEKRMTFIQRDDVLFGAGDVGYEESEILLPMCELKIDNHRQNQLGTTIANATMIRQKNPIEIMEKRLEEMGDMVIKYAGQEKLEELKAKIQAIKSQNVAKAKFSEQEIGKDTISTSKTKKDEAKERQQRDENQIVQEKQKNASELE